jgi:single-strand DNA-binding protein
MNETTLTLTGNLTTDPELRFTPNGDSVANFTVASTPRVFHKPTGEWRDGEPIFMRCTLWRAPAEHLAESLTRGARVIVTGRLRPHTWETREGEKRTTLQLDVDDIGASLKFAPLTVRAPQRTSSTTAADEPGNGEPPF